MNESRSMSTSELDLDAALHELGGALAAPAAPSAPDLAARVRARLEAERPRRTTVPWWLTLLGRARGGHRGGGGVAPQLRRSVLLAAAAILLVAAAVTAAIGYGLPGIRILLGPPPSIAPSATSPVSGPPGATLGLGTPVSLEEARELVDFEIALPDQAEFGPPDAVYLADGRLALAWGPEPALPGTAHEGLGLLLVEINARVDGNWIEKLVRTDTAVERVTVDGASGYWIEGERHVIAYIAPDGTRIEDSVRAVGKTLLWARDGVTYRLEGELTRDQAIALAETLR